MVLHEFRGHILRNGQFATALRWSSHHLSFTILTLLSLGRLRWCTFIHDPSPSSHLAPHSWAVTRKLKYSSQNQHCLFQYREGVFRSDCIGQCPTTFNARHDLTCLPSIRVVSLYPWEKNHRHSLGRRLVASQSRHGSGGTVKLPAHDRNPSL
jgi:hypothetical protein